jgi:hypothetical protein
MHKAPPCHALDEEHARHHRIAGEVSLEVWLVDGHVLDADGRAIAVHVDDPVDQEKRITMRQKLQDVGDFRRPELRLHSAFIHQYQLQGQVRKA